MKQITAIPALRDDNNSPRSRIKLAPGILSSSVVLEPPLLYFFVKRLLDVTLSILGILVLIPVFLVIAICIKLDDGGSVLHFREIIGMNGRRFFALKFRTMIPDADDYLA